MKIVYICEQYCVLHKNLDHLIIKKAGSKIASIPLIDTQCIVVFGNNQITYQLLNMLLQKGIDIIFMSESGLTRGRVLSEKANNIILRIAQFNRWSDE